jgi:hypothetical protein
MNWRGRPLTSHEVVVNTIAATTILMAAGAIGLVLFFYFWNRRRAPRVAQQPPRAAFGRNPTKPGRWRPPRGVWMKA